MLTYTQEITKLITTIKDEGREYRLIREEDEADVYFVVNPNSSSRNGFYIPRWMATAILEAANSDGRTLTGKDYREEVGTK